MQSHEIVLDPAQAADIEKFESVLAGYLAGDVDEDAFRVFRLNNGIYGQRQGGHNQMVRIKVPYGSIRPEQLEMIGHVADEEVRSPFAGVLQSYIAVDTERVATRQPIAWLRTH